MADGVIRDFLVSLGFDTDNSGLANMKSAMDGIEWKAKALNGALLALATGAVLAVKQTASELDKLYFSSQRIGASVTNINAYGNAIAQLGGSAEGAVGSLESLAEKIRNSPGYEGQIKSLGVNTRDANGAMRDRVEVMKDLSGVLAKMPSYQANAYANSLGIDQNTLMAMRDGKFMANMDKYQKIQKELGMNNDLAKSGNEFMTEYRDLTMMTKTGFQVIVMQAGKALIPILRMLNQLIQAGIHAFSQLNPQIKEGLAVGLRFAMLALMFGALAKSLGLLLKFIPAFKTFIGLLKLFRLAFLASPIGIILALGAALALLYDDYKTWKEGGKSLFDWSKWTNGIDTIINKIKDFLDILDKIKDKTIEFIQKIIKDPAGALKEVATEVQEGVTKTAEKVNDAVDKYINPTDPKKVTPTQDKVASFTDFTFSMVDKGLAWLGNADAQTRVEQRERGEIGYQSVATGAAIAAVSAVKNAVSSDSNKIVDLVGVDGKRRIYKMADGSTETRDDGTVAWRNNNPGNLKFEFKGSADKSVKSKRSKEKALSDAKKRYEGIVALDQWGNAIFETYEAGAVAKAKLLKSAHADKTVAKMLRSYAKDDYSGKTNYAAYENTIFKEGDSLGLDLRTKTIGQMSNKEFEALAVGMVKAEGVKKGTVSRTAPSSNILSNMFSNSSLDVSTLAPPSGNPHKSQINNSNAMTASNVIINQNYQTDMTINGASSPIESANAVKRQQENSMVFMARGARGVFVG
ncbi:MULTISPECIES: phage tail tape measure protein [unclassified Acinetobacter]|uniref:phage tail tape measure protein n=1 Tax=unclassified Acinetobacter TaxID=196816 RepID=UPI0025B87D50|nr:MULTISPECIES: phage tail tape measure protein [unclassified Acinetobacter]